MKASVRWLKELLPWLDLPAQEIAAALTRGGIEVEAVHAYGTATADVCVASVVEKAPHPSKSKLSLVTVDWGKGTQTVVCGAPNVPAKGGLVVFAPLGTTLPQGLTLTPREIGGVRSEGMLCSEAELGLGEGADGILILPQGSASVGTTLAEAVATAHDTILEIGLTPNRPDCLGHVGLARELSVLTRCEFRLPTPPTIQQRAGLKTEDHVIVDIREPERCPHYGAALVRDVQVASSPLWVRYRLEALGVRSISNVVDVTNLVMLLFGHPIHGFDFSRIRGGKIIVRRAVEGEQMHTLDGVQRKLDTDDLLIADADAPLALAGVMGGAGSELSDATKDILVECAYFAPRGVRRSARRHGLHTESSHRFERGVDPGDTALVLRYAAGLLCTLAAGHAAETFPVFGSGQTESRTIHLRTERISGLLGLEIAESEAEDTLTRLGCFVQSKPQAFEVSPPSHRPDLAIEEDLIEEIIRVYGVDRVPAIVPAIAPQPPRVQPIMAGLVRRAAIEVGLSETLTFGFVSKKDLELLHAPPPAFVLANPLSEDRSVMRTSLLPGLLEAVSRAERRGVANTRLFCVGARYERDDLSPLAREARSFAALLSGTRGSGLDKPVPLDAYDAKGVAVEIVERATSRVAVVANHNADVRPLHLHPRSSGRLTVNDLVVGIFGELHPRITKRLGLLRAPLLIELDLEVMERVGRSTPRFAPIPTLPATTRDLAVVVDEKVSADALLGAIRSTAGELCESAQVFDLFRGAGIPDGQRSIAFRVTYRDPKSATDPEHARTLTDAEVDARQALVLKAIGDRYGAVLRS